MQTINLNDRLSPLAISDPLTRVELYREIRDAQISRPSGWTAYETQPSEVLLPELIAYRVYKLDTLKWVVLIAAGLDDPREMLQQGIVLYLPTTAWIRERIKYYSSLEQS